MERQGKAAAVNETFWNGEPCRARRVRVRVGTVPRTWWCAGLEGAELEAVEVTYNGRTFFLDDANGDAWAKVTRQKGSPSAGHRSLPEDSVVVDVLERA